MGRGRLVDPRRSRRNAVELSRTRAAAREIAQRRDRMLKMGPLHAAADAELGTPPDPAHRRRSACHAAQCRARRLPGFRGRLHPRRAGCRLTATRLRPSPISGASASLAFMGCSNSRSPMPASSTCAIARRRRRQSPLARAASTVPPTGSGATIPLSNGTKRLPFPPLTLPDIGSAGTCLFRNVIPTDSRHLAKSSHRC